MIVEYRRPETQALLQAVMGAMERIRPDQKHISRLQLKLFSLHLKAETPGSNEKQLHLRMPVIIKGHLYPLFQTGLIDIYRKQEIPVLPFFPQGSRLSHYL